MAEINKNDIITEEAIQAPLRLADSLDKAVISIDKLITNGKKIEQTLLASKTVSELTKQTNGLAKSQADLETIQKGIHAKSIQRNKEELKSLDELVKKRESLRNRIQEQQKNQKEDVKLLKEGIITRQEYNKRILESQVAIAQYQQRIVALNRDVNNEILLNKTVGNEYKQLTIQLERARLQYKNMAASGQFSNDVLKKQGDIVRDLNRKVETIDKSVGQFSRNVGNYPNTFNAAAAGLRNFLGAFGLITGVALFAQVLRGVVSLTVEYGKKNSELQAVLGVTASQTRELREQQLKLGSSTAFNANQVAEMQIELAKLGFTTNEIKAMTASTLDAAQALGSDLGRQATLTGAALKAFRLPATEVARVNDVLAKSAAASALSFSQLETAIPIVAPIAAAFGFTIEDVTALLGELSNAGFDASMSATATRNILLNLADANGELAKSLGKPVKDLPSLIAGLKKLDKQGVDLATSLELTDKRSVAAFQTFLAGTDSIMALKATLDNAAGSARQMAIVMSDNVAGDAKLATSAWQGLVLAITEGDSMFSRVLRTVLQITTAFLRMITPVQEVTKELRKEQAQVNVLVKAITDENISRDARNKLIQELQTKYPDFLGNLKAETATNEQLSARLKDVNEEFRKKILLVSAEKALADVSERIVETVDREADAEVKLAEVRAANNKEMSVTDRIAKNSSNSLFREKTLLGVIALAQQDRIKLQEELTRRLEAYNKALALSGGAAPSAPGAVSPRRIARDKVEPEKQTNELLKFRLEQDVKIAKSVRERVFAEIALELFRKSELLKNEKLTQDERTAIIERSMANVKAIQLKGREDDLELRIEHLAAIGAAEGEAIQQMALKEIAIIKQNAIARGQITEQEEKRIQQIKNRSAEEIVGKQIQTVTKLLKLEELSKEERAAMEKELFDLKIKLTDLYFEHLEDREKTGLEKTAEILDKVEAVYSGFSNQITNISNTFTANEISNLDAQLRAMERKTARDIQLAGDNEAAKKQIELASEKRREQLEKKKVAAQRKAAKFQKASALIAAGINVAQAVTAALTAGPLIGQVLAAITAALGAVEIAAIAAAPLPQYRKGAKPGQHKGGAAIVGEAGVELVKPKGGNPFLTPNKATIMDIPAGAEVIPHEDTMRALAYSAMGEQSVLDSENRRLQQSIQKLERTTKEANKEVVKAISKNAINFSKQGSILNNHIKDLDGNTKIIRQKIFGS